MFVTLTFFPSVAANYNELYQWSVEFYPEFWTEFWDFSGLVYSRMYNEVSAVLVYSV